MNEYDKIEALKQARDQSSGVGGVGQLGLERRDTFNPPPPQAGAFNGPSREMSVAERLEQKIWEHKTKAAQLERFREKLSIEFLSMPSSVLDALK